jgi:hypothetical protein
MMDDNRSDVLLRAASFACREMGGDLGHAPRVARGADAATLATEGDEPLVATGVTTGSSEAVSQDSAAEVGSEIATELISNNAAAVLITPIAVATAAGLGVSHVPFVIAVMLAASNSFMTPIGYQTNTFVYGPGGYRFADFLRVGGPLNLILAGAAAIVIPWLYPFLP